MTHIVPPTTNAHKKIMAYHFLTQSRLRVQYKGWNRFAEHLMVNEVSRLRRREYVLIAFPSTALKNDHKQRPLNWQCRLHLREPADPHGRWSNHSPGTFHRLY